MQGMFAFTFTFAFAFPQTRRLELPPSNPYREKEDISETLLFFKPGRQ
jgi:hypothetical protein